MEEFQRNYDLRPIGYRKSFACQNCTYREIRYLWMIKYRVRTRAYRTGQQGDTSSFNKWKSSPRSHSLWKKSSSCRVLRISGTMVNPFKLWWFDQGFAFVISDIQSGTGISYCLDKPNMAGSYCIWRRSLFLLPFFCHSHPIFLLFTQETSVNNDNYSVMSLRNLHHLSVKWPKQAVFL